MSNTHTTDWRPILEGQTKQDYWKSLMGFVQKERATGQVFPNDDDVFTALHLTPYSQVKVLILGQDPYHGDSQAMGLSFSVPEGVALPPSLVNIFKEMREDLGTDMPTSGDLTHWAEQGVLLLNSVLTVRAHQAASHQGKGWENFTDAVIEAVNAKQDHVVFILWGGFARKPDCACADCFVCLEKWE